MEERDELIRQKQEIEAKLSSLEKNKKYTLTTESKIVSGIKLFRIEALISFGKITIGDKGGWIEKEENLSQNGNAWVYDNACVFGNAWVSDDAWVYGNARVFGNARVSGNAWVSGDACVYDDTHVYGNAWVSGRFNLTIDIDFELPRITVDSKDKLTKLKEFLDNF